MLRRLSLQIAWGSRPRGRVIGLRRILTGFSLSLASMLFATRARAADMVNLRYLDVQARVSVADMEKFAEDGETSAPLQAFLEQTPLSTENLETLLDAAIPDTGIPLGSTDIQFLLFQLNKLVGDPSNRAELQQPLGIALRSAYLDGDMSIIELVRRYPEPEVRLDLRRLSIVHRDADLFVRRLSTLFTFFEELLPDLVCECETEAVALASTSEPTPDHGKAACGQIDDSAIGLKTAATLTQFQSWEPALADYARDPFEAAELGSTGELQPVEPIEFEPVEYAQADKAVVIALGPLQRSFSIAELATFAETGDVPRSWRPDFRLANVNAEDLQAILTSEVEVDLLEMDSLLNSLPGEYALFQFGRLVHTPSRRANVQAMRGAVILSAAGDNKITLLEILQNYPTQRIIVEGPKLIRLGKSLSRRGGVEIATQSLEDLLVEIQVAIAADICDCDEGASSAAESL